MRAQPENTLIRYMFVLLMTAILGAMLLPVVSGCGDDGEAVIPGQLRAWIDAPLNGSTIPLAPYEVVAHGADASGVEQMELTVNDGREAGESYSGGDVLVTMRHTWKPPGPGVYILRARALSREGVWSGFDTVTVNVQGPAGAATTPTTGTATTPQAGGGQQPGPAAGDQPASISGPERSAEIFYYKYCGVPNEVTLEISASDPDGVGPVVIRYRLKKAEDQSTPWMEKPMNALGGGRYRATLVAEDDFGHAYLAEESTLEYQFVVKDSKGNTTASEIRADIVLMGCSARIPPR